MRILVVTQYFWPENFRINDFCDGLTDRGHEIVVLTGIPNYPDGRFYKGYSFSSTATAYKGKIKIYRSWLLPRRNAKGYNLALNYLSFACLASLKAVFISEKHFDRIFVFEPSPITVGLPAIVASKRFKAPIILWVQDLWPHSVTAASNINNAFIIKTLDRLTRYIYSKCRYVAVQSKAFVNYIREQQVNPEKIIYLPNTSEALYQVQPCISKYARLMPEGFCLMFAGNIGAAQSFETLIDAARILKADGIAVNWVVLGDGRMRTHVEELIKQYDLSSTFRMLGAYPASEMPAFFACADALLVSLKRDPIFALTIPSKVQSYMACGKPIIASIDGEGANIIAEAGAGFTSAAEDAVALAANIKAMVALSKQERASMGVKSRKYYDMHFDREMLLDRFERLLS